MPALLHDDWTAARARALPDDGNRYEVLDGELFVTPAPSYAHQSIIERLFPLLQTYTDTTRVGWAKLSPADIEFSPRRLLQPDILIVPWRDPRPASWADVTSLVLAVEVVAPTTARADRQVKRRVYQSQRVAEYWIVDGDARLVERWNPEADRPEIITEHLVWLPDGAESPLTIDLPALFA